MLISPSATASRSNTPLSTKSNHFTNVSINTVRRLVEAPLKGQTLCEAVLDYKKINPFGDYKTIDQDKEVFANAMKEKFDTWAKGNPITFSTIENSETFVYSLWDNLANGEVGVLIEKCHKNSFFPKERQTVTGVSLQRCCRPIEQFFLDEKLQQWLRDQGIGGPLSNQKLLNGEVTIAELKSLREQKLTEIAKNFVLSADDTAMLEESPAVVRFFIDGLITLKQISDFTDDHYAILNNPYIQQWIDKQLLLCSDALKYSTFLYPLTYGDSDPVSIKLVTTLNEYTKSGFLSFPEIFKMYEEGSPSYLSGFVITEAEKKIIATGLITAKNLLQLPDHQRRLLGNPEVSLFLEKNLISFDQLMALSAEEGEKLLTPEIQKYIQKGLLSIDTALTIQFSYVRRAGDRFVREHKLTEIAKNFVLSAYDTAMLEESPAVVRFFIDGLITLKQISDFTADDYAILSNPYIQQWIDKQLLLCSDALKYYAFLCPLNYGDSSDPAFIKLVTTLNEYTKSGFLSFPEIFKMYEEGSPHYLSGFVITETEKKIIATGLITAKNLLQLPGHQRRLLQNPEVSLFLEKNLISFDQLMALSAEEGEKLLTPEIQKYIQKGLLSIDTALTIQFFYVRHAGDHFVNECGLTRRAMQNLIDNETVSIHDAIEITSLDGVIKMLKFHNSQSL